MQAIRTQKFSSRVGVKTSEMMIQQGTLVGSLTGRYKSFPTAFAVAPQVTLTPMTGTVLWFRARSVAAASFSCAGSPTAKVFRYIAYGSV